MRDLGGVRMREAVQNAAQDFDGAGQRDRAIVADPGAQCRPANEGTGVIDERAGAARTAGPHEIRMLQPLGDQ